MKNLLIVTALCLSASVALASVDKSSSRLALPNQVGCTNCNSTGWVILDCPRCQGKGKVSNPRKRSTPPVPCPQCVKGLSTPDKTGTGKIRRTCPVCKGLKKIKNQL